MEWRKKEGSSIETEGGEFLKDIVNLSTTYALQVGKGKAEEILGAFSSIYPNLEATIMTAAQQLEERGIRQGIYSIAQSMLRDREPIDKIQKWTGLTREEIYGSES